jgi:hypothetical protein
MPGVPSGQKPDYHFIPRGQAPRTVTGQEQRADAVIANSGNIDSIIKNALDKIGGQAEILVIEIGKDKSASILDSAVLAWGGLIFGTSGKIQRLIVIRNTNGVRKFVLDVIRSAASLSAG